MYDDIDRRTILQWTGATTGAIALAGCLGGDDDADDEDDPDDESAIPLEVEDLSRVPDPPDAVYLPTHRESMEMLEPVEAGPYTVAPMLSYPHPFWLVTGADEVEHVEPETMAGVHLMFTVWDDETDTVLPIDEGIELELFRDGEAISSPQSAWSMLSQEMGFHFGDNVALEDDGTYTVEVDLPALDARTTGDLANRFDESATATFEFEYDQAFRDRVSNVDYLDEERWGEQGALEPMHGNHDDGHHDDGHHDDGHHDDEHHDDEHHDVPYSQLPAVDELPETLLVEPGGDRPAETADLPRSGDAAFLATLLESGARLADGDEERYLLVSPRTPYNRVPLPAMTLEVTVERDGEAVAPTPVDLDETVDDEFGHHYGTSFPDVEPGDAVTIGVDSPPQVARHQGYETAFHEMPAIELEVPDDG